MGTPELKYDVFISYRWIEPDRTWVQKQLKPALSKAGLKVFLDVEDFVPGRHVISEMTRAALESRHAIFVLSPDYVSGNLSLFEALFLVWSDPTGSQSRLIPLLFRPTSIPEWIAPLISVDWTQAEDRPREWRKLLRILGAPNRSVPYSADDKLPAPADERPTSAIASREAVFTSDPSLPEQVFAVELLTQSLVLSKIEHGRICVTIDRNKVKEAVYNNEGKHELCQRTFADPSTVENAFLWDQKIHEFLCGRSQEPGVFLKLKDLDLHLRWASGGAISVVHWRGRQWTPFFFRDISPYGWNISLGASERGDDLNDRGLFCYGSSWRKL